jgi:hypothetical protein
MTTWAIEKANEGEKTVCWRPEREAPVARENPALHLWHWVWVAREQLPGPGTGLHAVRVVLSVYPLPQARQVVLVSYVAQFEMEELTAAQLEVLAGK